MSSGGNTKNLSVITWHHQTPQRRALKRGRLGPPDLYPQDPKQDEDSLGDDRLKKGYQVAITSYEHESISWNAKIPRSNKLDETMSRGAQIIMQIINRKTELNANLDKERKRGSKEGAFQGFSHTTTQALKSKERKEWFLDLARGKSLTSLAKRPPFFKKKEGALEYLCDYKVPVARALWYIKLAAVGQAIASNVAKQKKSVIDQLASEHGALFIKFIRCMLTQISETHNLEANIVYTERWPYFVCLCKHAYEDGMIERQEFLMDLCDIFAERFVIVSDNKPHFFTLFRMFLMFFSQYIDQVTQNLILSRRCAFLIAKRLAIYKEEAELLSGRPVVVSELFHELLQCQNQRPIVLILTGMFYAILIDCPGALVWNYFRVAEGRPPAMLHQLCGSPLDQLPCAVEEIPALPGYGADKIQELIQMRITEVKRRSYAVENRWSLNRIKKTIFAKVVHACLEVLGALDAARIDQPRYIERIHRAVFGSQSKEKFEQEDAIRIKMLLHWAVTVEREGTHRALTVAYLLNYRKHRKDSQFGDQQLQEILLDYLDTESPQPSDPHFEEEFRNLMHLFYEFQKLQLFSHDSYVKGLITTGQMSDQTPVLTSIKNREEQKAKQRFYEIQTKNLMNGMVSEEKFNDGTGAAFSQLQKDTPDEHSMMGIDLTRHERFLIHLPIPQIKRCRSDCNQRALLLHGVGEQRDLALNDLRKIAKEIIKIWSKRIVIEFSQKPVEIRFKRRATVEQINAALQKFKAQYFYDQIVLCGWFTEVFISMVSDFVDGHNTVLPSAEGLDVLLSMLEHCKFTSGIMDFAKHLLPLLVDLERKLTEQRVDCVPSNISAQLGFVLVAYISHNFNYFILCEHAVDIVNGLYRIVEKQLSAKYLTGWGRTISVFVLNTKKRLLESDLSSKKLDVKNEDLMKVGPVVQPLNVNATYNSQFFKDLLDSPRRIFSFNDYRNWCTTLEKYSDARYSFVVNALKCAHQCSDKYDRLIELANICGHISAIALLSAEWCGALQALCCSSVAGNHGFAELLFDINVEDSKCHTTIATFYMLLAGRSCFSMNLLFHELLRTVFHTLINSDTSKTDTEAEAGVCLALLVLANMVCQSEKPIVLSSMYAGENYAEKQLFGMADKYILCASHLFDMGNEIFDLLFSIASISDCSKNKLRDWHDENRMEQGTCREYIAQLSKAVLLAMCEQDWITQRVYRICEETNLDIFNSLNLRKNGLGQQLLRMALRRKCERKVVEELTICNGNSKKSLIDKLFSVLNIWNMRATYFDLKLMIKEISPEGTGKVVQQGAIAADALIGEIGKCCRDMFVNSRGDGYKLPENATGKGFRLKYITNFWLISPLIYSCPKPVNLPQSFSGITVQAKFLKEAALMLDTTTDNSHERVQQSVWLLSQEPFINLVLTCLKGEDQQRDGLVNSLLKQLQEVMLKIKDNLFLPYLHRFSLEREGILLRCSLVGAMFDSVCHQNCCDAWALLFFQFMLYGANSREKNRYLFESCYDMLSTLLIWSKTDPMSVTPINSQDPDTKYRFSNYVSIVKKLKKELNERTLIPELRSLLQFLPISKSTFDLATAEPYGTVVPSPQKLSKGQFGSASSKVYRIGLQLGDKVKLSAFDMIHNFNAESTAKRSWTWAMFQAVKLDKSPVPIQRYIQRLVQHTHYTEFSRPAICGGPIGPMKDKGDEFLSPPAMDIPEVSMRLQTTASSTSTSNGVSVNTGPSSSIAPITATELQPPPSRSLPFQNANQINVNQNPGGDPMMFTGTLQAVPDLNQNPPSASPRGGRGGRRRGAGPANRATGTTRKKQQRQALEKASALAPQMTQTIGPPGNSGNPGYWGAQPAPQNPPIGYMNTQQGGMNQSEDSKATIQRFVMKRQAAQASGSTQTYGNMPPPASGGQYNPMMMKMESNATPMDHQQSYAGPPQQMGMVQDPQRAQFNAQQDVYGQQQQANPGNVFDNRMMGHHQQQPMQFNQLQFQQQY